jgi:formimidoylglutamase
MKKSSNRRKNLFPAAEKITDDPRLKNLIKNWDSKSRQDVAILGVPFDHGVEISGGRVGAAKAPDAIREQLKKYGTAHNTEKNADLSALSIADFGDIKITKKEFSKAHEIISRSARVALENSDITIVIGGGHDTTFGTVRALSQLYAQKIGGINTDAHFDARPVVGGNISSGNPFRLLLDGKFLPGKNFFEVASQGHVNAKAHKEYLESHGVHIYFLSDVRNFGVANVFKKAVESAADLEAFFVSVDIDSIAQAFAPGSSAPSPDGLSPKDILAAAYLCGKNPKVKLFEIMELNPKYDIDNRTSRLAANIILEFLAGVAQRKTKK